MTQINQIQKKKLVMQTEIPNTSGLVKKRDYNAKITETESKIPSISGLATTYVLNAVENKIPDVSTLTKKQIMVEKYQILNLNMSLQLITINLRS